VHPFHPALPGHEVSLSHFVQHLANTFRSHVPLPNPAANLSNQEPWFFDPSSCQLNANEQRFQLARSRNIYSQLKVKSDHSAPSPQAPQIILTIGG